MGISSQNAILNQYVPPFCVDRPVGGDVFVYDSLTRSWANKSVSDLGLTDISPEDLTWQNGVFGPGDVVTISEDLTTFVSTPSSELGATEFTALSDTPTEYAGQAGKMVVVNGEENALQFIDVPTPPKGQITSMDFGSFVDANARLDAGTF